MLMYYKLLLHNKNNLALLINAGHAPFRLCSPDLSLPTDALQIFLPRTPLAHFPSNFNRDQSVHFIIG